MLRCAMSRFRFASELSNEADETAPICSLSRAPLEPLGSLLPTLLAIRPVLEGGVSRRFFDALSSKDARGERHFE